MPGRVEQVFGSETSSGVCLVRICRKHSSEEIHHKALQDILRCVQAGLVRIGYAAYTIAIDAAARKIQVRVAFERSRCVNHLKKTGACSI